MIIENFDEIIKFMKDIGIWFISSFAIRADFMAGMDIKTLGEEKIIEFFESLDTVLRDCDDKDFFNQFFKFQ